ncbi:hypothetical protein M4L90_02605 [Staphylococcus equorum]|uniref:Uncharacterized protein n=1 Tax=Staphylococcus equorum TaxID=246432 RepID=A0A9X4L6T2_9STAP|nr:hypothetical protein [Staphylococcus equorum]MDG0818779.1 hypothetical protein [Staphylococcus equorum]MDG0839420.1 hypothetical protein [Staphylococcus equorum]MDG0844854.1 hypothetical protein [Staphylococcus equorum]
MTKVNIQLFDQDKQGNLHETDQSKAVEIKAIRPGQLGAIAKVVNGIQKDLQDNKEFQDTVIKLFGQYTEGFDIEDLIRSEDFNIFDVLSAFGFLVEKVPERTIELTSVASGIDSAYLEVQDMDTFFEVIEAIVEVNDIEKIVKRVKSLMDKVGKAVNFNKGTKQTTSKKQ